MIQQAFSRDWEQNLNAFLTDPVPADVRDHGARTVADVLAAAVAGARVPSIETVSRNVGFADGPASILGTTRRTSPSQAALVTGAAAIAQEVEEGHNTGGHVGAGIVAGGLPVAEANGIDGETFVDACIRAYEVCARVERAIFVMKDRINGAVPWLVRNPHSTWTVLGPAVATAIIQGAGPATLRETVRIAGNLAVVSMFDPFAEGAPSRNFTAGFSAQVGVSAAQAAIAGLTGSREAMERVYDPFDEIGPADFTDRIETLGDEWLITENYFKPWPSCRYTHPPLAALEAAVGDTPIDLRDVERIKVASFENAIEMNHDNPQTMTGAKFSTPYVLARYLTDRSVDLEDFTTGAIGDAGVRSLASTVDLVRDDEFEAAFPDRWGARVTVELADGTTYSGECEDPPGGPHDPLTDEEWQARTRELLAYGLPAQQVEDGMAALDDVAEHPVRATVAALTPESH
ncbi:MAG: MmgE/PrpD family protein [Salinirussus sp.]